MIAIKNQTNPNRLLTLIAGVVVIVSLYFGRAILIPLALAFVFAFLLTPLVALVEKIRLGRAPSVVIVLLLIFTLAIGVTWLVTGQVLEIGEQIPNYKSNIHNKIQSLRSSKPSALTRAATTVSDLSDELSAASENAASREGGKKTGKGPIAVEVAQPASNASEYLTAIIGPLSGIVETSLMVVIFTLFMLVNREDLRNRLIRLAGGVHLNLMTRALDDVSQRLGRYLFLQFLVNAGYGLLFGIATRIIGLPHALLWGVLAGLLRFIPYLGAPTAALLPMAFALAVFPGWSQVGLIFAAYLGLELVLTNLIEPWLYGSHTGVSSLAILVAAVFWALLWGPVGLLLSTPLTVCLMLIGRYVPELAFLDVLLGDDAALSPQAHFYQRLLATDPDEARDLVEEYKKEKTLEELYDSVLIPALSLAETDRHMNVLDAESAAFIFRTTRELIEDPDEESANVVEGSSPILSRSAKTVVICVPAGDEADELVAIMLSQLLRRAGVEGMHIPVGNVTEMLETVSRKDAHIVCVSALPPSASGQARSLCRQLRKRFPERTIILGLWNFDGGAARAQERIGPGCANKVATTLADVVALAQLAAGEASLELPALIQNPP